MEKREDIFDDCRPPALGDRDMDEAFEEAASSIWRDISFSSDFPDWLADSFQSAMLKSVSEAAYAVKRLAIDGVLPIKYQDFQRAHIKHGIPYSVTDLLVLEYFSKGRIKNGATREDIKLYDLDLYNELEVYEKTYGPLPSELHIPHHKHEQFGNHISPSPS